ncbi:MAG: amidohydrolase family protein, partial [Gemmatimonadetes bacterium]|nr:amidohydrolase family protein [Gemmatimonadota bacterium]
QTGAEIMGRAEEFGTLEAGKLADVLVVAADLEKDIAALEDTGNFIAVVQGCFVKAGRLAQHQPAVRGVVQ